MQRIISENPANCLMMTKNPNNVLFCEIHPLSEQKL